MLYNQMVFRRCLTVCNFFSTSTTKQNCKNNDFQTGFTNTGSLLIEIPPLQRLVTFAAILLKKYLLTIKLNTKLIDYSPSVICIQ